MIEWGTSFTLCLKVWVVFWCLQGEQCNIVPDNVDDIVADIAQEEKEEGLHLFIFLSKATLSECVCVREGGGEILTIQYPKIPQSNEEENSWESENS